MLSVGAGGVLLVGAPGPITKVIGAGSLRLLIVAGVALLVVGIYNYYLIETASECFSKEKMNDQSS